MALPVDAGRAVTNSTTSGLTHSLNLPGSIAAGNILVAVVRAPASTTISWPAGWTEWEQNNADASDDETSLAYRVADGTEGATITITLGTSRILVGYCVRVTGATDLVFSAGATHTTQPNSPSLALGQTALDTLWLSIGGTDGSQNLTSGPTSYTNATSQKSTATGASGCTVYGATRGLNATTEDPGAWTLGANSNGVTWTVALTAVGAPIRMAQEPVEAAVLPTDQKARIAQEPVEVVVLPTDQKARLAQLPVEVAVQPSPGLRVSMEPVEVVHSPTDTKARVTQAAVEVIMSLKPALRISQAVVEVVMQQPLTVRKTQTATARIQVTGTKTQTAHAAIENTATKTQTARAYIASGGGERFYAIIID